eukprot:12111251-Alexandrium_andersonii.AAC.1
MCIRDSMFDADSCRALVVKAERIASIVVDVYWGLGLKLSMGVNKTALLLALWGHMSRTVRRELSFQSQCELCVRGAFGEKRIPIVD